jgi:hypothetical protein
MDTSAGGNVQSSLLVMRLKNIKASIIENFVLFSFAIACIIAFSYPSAGSSVLPLSSPLSLSLSSGFFLDNNLFINVFSHG